MLQIDNFLKMNSQGGIPQKVCSRFFSTSPVLNSMHLFCINTYFEKKHTSKYRFNVSFRDFFTFRMKLRLRFFLLTNQSVERKGDTEEKKKEE